MPKKVVITAFGEELKFYHPNDNSREIHVEWTLDGVFVDTWLSPEKRRALIELLQERG